MKKALLFFETSTTTCVKLRIAKAIKDFSREEAISGDRGNI
jgi:hypothetical protein